MEASIIIMLGAMVSAGLLCVPLVRLLKISSLVRASANQRHGDLNRTVHDLVGLAEIRQKHSLVVMAQSAATMKDPLLARGVTMALEGRNSTAIRGQLEGSYLGAQGNASIGTWEIARSVCVCVSLIFAAIGAIQMVIAGINGTDISSVTAVVVAVSIFTGMISGVLSRGDWSTATGNRSELLRRLIVVEGVVSLAEGLDAKRMRERLMGLMPGQGEWVTEAVEIKRAA